MLETAQLLSSKIKIAVGPRKPESFSQRHVGGYMNYSSFVLRALRGPTFQKFLQWMLRRERIEAQMVGAVDVRVFPLRRKNGRSGRSATQLEANPNLPKNGEVLRVHAELAKALSLMYAGNRAGLH
jgi:hypothetical protein